jgi:hypothetical protein
MEYMDKHFPVVQFGDMKVKIAYSLGRGEEDNGWTCDKVSKNTHFCELGRLLTVAVFIGQFSASRSLLSMWISSNWYHLLESLGGLGD